MIARLHRGKIDIAYRSRVAAILDDAQTSEALVLGGGAGEVEVVVVLGGQLAQVGLDLVGVRRCGGHGLCNVGPGLFVGDGGLRATK